MSYKLEIQDLSRDACLLSQVDLAAWPPLPTLESIRRQFESWLDTPSTELTQPILKAVISLQTPLGNSVERQSWLGFWRNQGESENIDWQEGPGLTPQRIIISADLDGFYAWGEHGEGISLSAEFPHLVNIQALEVAMHAWAWPYDQAYSACQFVKQNMHMDWEIFNHAGMALASRLHALLGDSAVVFYEKASWDATRANDPSCIIG